MADHEKDKQIDEMLDSLLANYASAEPRPGLETRILANLRSAPGREASPGWWHFKWLWAGAAIAAAMLLAAVLIHGRRHVAPPIQAIQAPHTASRQPAAQHSLPATAVTAVPHGRKTTVTARSRNATLALSQRPALFPTPVALSEQEKLMFAYLANTPREVVIAQIQRDDRKEADAFWEDREPSSGPQRLPNTR